MFSIIFVLLSIGISFVSFLVTISFFSNLEGFSETLRLNTLLIKNSEINAINPAIIGVTTQPKEILPITFS